MSNKTENAILFTMGLVMICLFFVAMLNPRSADAAFLMHSQPPIYQSLFAANR